MAAREIPNLKVVGSTPTWVILPDPSLAQLAERLTVVVAMVHTWASTCRWFDSGSSDSFMLYVTLMHQRRNMM